MRILYNEIMNYFFNDLSQDEIKNIIGVNDANLTLLEELYDCGIVYRDNCFKLLSDDQEVFTKFSRHMDLLTKMSSEELIDYDLIKQTFIHINEEKEESFPNEVLAFSYNGRPFKCKTLNQHRFIRSIADHDLTFAIGPAGTGKTFLAVLTAVCCLKKNDVSKIIITRPAVEAGESLGFLPGDLKEKIDPYLMPIYDALDIILGSEQKDKMIEKGVIEVIPLAYMRGRTLDKAFIILDEAQNTTDKQMLMFLTRLGFNSKMVVNGDITQIDLNINRSRSGLKIACDRLKDIEGIGFVEFDRSDVIRNPLVSVIIDRFKID